MIFYHITTVYQLLNAVAHMQKNNSFDTSDILLASWMKNKIKNIDMLENLFRRVLYYDASLTNISADELEEKINDNLNGFLAKNKINLSKYDEIVVGGVQYNFGMYLCVNKISFNVFEESCGIYSHPEVLESIDTNIPNSSGRVALAKGLGLYDYSNPYIKKVYCDISAQTDNTLKKMEDLRVLEILSSLEEDKLKILLETFGVNVTIECESDSVFLLTQQFSWLNILDFKDHLLIYQLFADFFLDNKKLLVKPHPDDACYYSQLLENCYVIKEKFPSELTPFVFSTLPQTVATISSTGLMPLQHLFDNVIKLDFSYEKSFRSTIRYYAAVKLLSELNIKSCTLVGANKVLLEQLVKTNDLEISFNSLPDTDSYEVSTEDVLLIDSVGHDDKKLLGLLKPNIKLIIFLNSDNSYGFYRFEARELFDSIIPFKLIKKVVREEDNYVNKKPEVLYIYSKNEEIVKAMEKITMEKELTNTGISFKPENLSAEQLEIERLKGILEATEKRLLYYINKEKETEKKAK